MLKKFSMRITVCLFLFFGFGVTQNVTIVPAQPTHMLYTPRAEVNPPGHMVIGLHEISYAFPGNLQLQASLLDNIGRINVGAKFGLGDNLSVGAGLANSLMHITSNNRWHGMPDDDHRLGVFLCYGIMKQSAFENAITFHTQIGERVSAGIDFGLMASPTKLWSVIWEVGSSFDMKDQWLYLNTDGGIRINPDKLPFLFFDLGIDMEEFAPFSDDDSKNKPTVALYIDFMFSMDTN